MTLLEKQESWKKTTKLYLWFTLTVLQTIGRKRTTLIPIKKEVVYFVPAFYDEDICHLPKTAIVRRTKFACSKRLWVATLNVRSDELDTFNTKM